jgi:hypothetical protein
MNLLPPASPPRAKTTVEYNAKVVEWQGQQPERPFLWIRSPKLRFAEITGTKPDFVPSFPQKTRTNFDNRSALQPQIERVFVGAFNLERSCIGMQGVEQIIGRRGQESRGHLKQRRPMAQSPRGPSFARDLWHIDPI